MKQNRSKAFSLVELLVVVAIIAILTGIATPIYKQYKIRAAIASVMVLMDSYVKQVEIYYIRNGEWPSSPSVLGYTTYTFSGDNNSNSDCIDASQVPSSPYLTTICIFVHDTTNGCVAAWIPVSSLNIAQSGSFNYVLLQQDIIYNTDDTFTYNCYLGGGSSVYNSYIPSNCTT